MLVGMRIERGGIAVGETAAAGRIVVASDATCVSICWAEPQGAWQGARASIGTGRPNRRGASSMGYGGAQHAAGRSWPFISRNRQVRTPRRVSAV